MAAPAPKLPAMPNQQFYTYKNQVPPDMLAAGSSVAFQPGRGYYIKSPGAAAGGSLAAAAAADPYSALTGYQPMTAAQIQQQAQGEISPILQAITGQAGQQAQAAGQQISALTQDYANELGQINLAAPYQQAEPQQAAVDSALQQSLNGAGSSEAAGLANRLAGLQGSSGAPAVGQAGGALAAQGVGSGNTALANGSAALSNLIANAAAGGEFGAKLPAIAKLSGLQALGENAGQLQQTTNNAVLQAETQLPSIIQDLAANNETGLANAVTAQQKQQALNFDNWVKGQTVKQGAQKVGIAAENAQTAATRAADTAAYQQVEAQLKQEGITATNARAAAALKAKVAQGARPDPSLSKIYGYIVDANGQPILDAAGKKIPVKATGSSSSAAVPPWGK